MEETVNRRFRRGEIYYCDFGECAGSVQGGVRPVVILQRERFNNKSPTVIVAAITTVIKKTYLKTHIYLGASYGLSRNSMVLLEQIKVVNKSQIKNFIGYIDNGKILSQINDALKDEFDIRYYTPERTGIIRTLCGKCLGYQMKKKSQIVKRIDPLSKEKCRCSVCHKETGYDYFIFDKRSSIGKEEQNESGR